MKCPACNLDLAMVNREGVEIDYCPKCRGIWLDRGELDKLIERESPERASSVRESSERDDDDDDEDDDFGRRGRRSRGDDEYSHGRRKSFFGQWFDFG